MCACVCMCVCVRMGNVKYQAVGIPSKAVIAHISCENLPSTDGETREVSSLI